MAEIAKKTSRRKDYTGHKFGMLTVLGDAPDRKSHRYLDVICDCGTRKPVNICGLKSGSSSSCGCKNKTNVVGKKFGRLLVIKQIDPINGNQRIVCRCDCGNEITCFKANVVRLHTSSCGCFSDERRRDPERNCPAKSHGMSRTTEYRIWNRMLDRCSNPNHHAFDRYGGRGITVCQSWQESFEAFFADVGNRPSLDCTLDRIDNDKGYNKENCKWSSKEEQCSNTVRNRYTELGGEKLTYAQAARALDVQWSTIARRVKAGKLPDIENTYS